MWKSRNVTLQANVSSKWAVVQLIRYGDPTLLLERCFCLVLLFHTFASEFRLQSLCQDAVLQKIIKITENSSMQGMQLCLALLKVNLKTCSQEGFYFSYTINVLSTHLSSG